jgi:hypothetical protein
MASRRATVAPLTQHVATLPVILATPGSSIISVAVHQPITRRALAGRRPRSRRRLRAPRHAGRDGKRRPCSIANGAVGRADDENHDSQRRARGLCRQNERRCSTPRCQAGPSGKLAARVRVETISALHPEPRHRGAAAGRRRTTGLLYPLAQEGCRLESELSRGARRGATGGADASAAGGSASHRRRPSCRAR